MVHDTTDHHVGASIVTVQDEHHHHPAVITLAMEPSGDDHYLSAVNHDEDDLDHKACLDRDHVRPRYVSPLLDGHFFPRYRTLSRDLY